MTYRKSDSEIQAEQAQYKKKYKPFRPFTMVSEERSKIGKLFELAVTTQNGQDTDDYAVTEYSDKVKKYLSHLLAGKKVLLLGTGTGREILSALDLGLDAVGTTLGSRNIDFAREYLNIDEARIFEKPNESLPFPSNTFDCVAGFQVFEHTIAPTLFLLEQGRILKTGGELLLEWPPAKDYTMDANPHHQICFTPGQAKALFQKCGFINIKLTYSDGSTIPIEDYWRGDQVKMLVISGQKGQANHEYVRTAWKGGL